MLTWDEAFEAYKPDLITHYEIGRSTGLIDGALIAYKDVLTAINLEPEPTIAELNELLNTAIMACANQLEEE
jgi:hypothetical protein